MTGQLAPRSAGAAIAESRDAIAFDVRGLPVPQGTARAFVAAGRAIVTTEANRTSSPLGAWRAAIATEARRVIVGPLIADPVEVSLVFRMPRPRSHYHPAGSRRPAPELRLDAPRWHAGKPDADKLTRAALDALMSVVIADDSQVARLSVSKRYVDELEGPGVAVRVTRPEVTR